MTCIAVALGGASGSMGRHAVNHGLDTLTLVHDGRTSTAVMNVMQVSLGSRRGIPQLHVEP